MFFIPVNHADAMSWINSAWHKIGLTPYRTSELLAVCCGFENWQSLCEAISDQYRHDFTIKEYHKLSWSYIENRIGGDQVEALKLHQIEKMKEFGLENIHDLIFLAEILSILRIPTMANNEKNAPVMLRDVFISLAGSGLRVVPEPSSEAEESDGVEINTDPQKYIDFAVEMGWKVVQNQAVFYDKTFSARFKLELKNGNMVPVMLSQQARFGRGFSPPDEAFQVARTEGGGRAILLFGKREEYPVGHGKILTIIGVMLNTLEGEEVSINLIANKLTKSSDALIDINEKYINVIGFDKGIPAFMCDTGKYAAKMYDKHIN